MSDAKAPGHLVLKFSEAADFERLVKIFDPAIKKEFDPENHVVFRLRAVFVRAVNEGSIAFLCDETGATHAISAAYRCREGGGDDHDDIPDHTEIGSSLSFLPGFRGTVPVIAALTLKEYLQCPPRLSTAVEIGNDNRASIHVYRDILCWEPVHDRSHCDSLSRTCDATIPEKPKQAPFDSTSDDPESRHWLECTAATRAALAKILLDYRKSGCLGGTLPVDFSALDDAGLTVEKLCEIVDCLAFSP